MQYRFDDIAINSISKKKPTTSDKDTYLGLEHLDSENLTVTRFGSDVAPIGEKLIMKKGDVLFGKRRAYQRKVAIAPFDGIFSAHGMVLRPKEKVVYKDFFPLFISSDYFLDAAIKISVGSLSPTINWSALRELEFELPPIDRQKQISKILWAAIEAKNTYKTLLLLTEQIVKSRFVEMFGDPVTNPMRWEKRTLQELMNNGSVTYHLDGNHGELYPRSDEFVNEGIPYIGANCINNGKIEYQNAKYLSVERADKFRKGVAINGDVMFAHNATVGPVAILETILPKVILSTSLTAYRCDLTLMNPYFLKAYMESQAFVLQYKAEMGQTTRNQVPITKQRSFLFLVPPLSLQNRFAEFVRQAEKSKFAAQRQTKIAKFLYNNINGG